MKLTASITAYNENLFLDYCIRSVYDYVDEIILTDTGMESSLSAGFGHRSTDGAANIVDRWVDNKKVFLAPTTKNPPKTFKDLMVPAFNMAKDRGADWYFTICGDEIWPKSSLAPMRQLLKNYENKGILGLNTWMWMFAPDFWHYKDFRNPRLAKITKDCELISGDAVYYTNTNLYQFAGNCETFAPEGTPKDVLAINADYPKNLRAYHYSCVGKERVEFKVNFYKKHNNTFGDNYNKAYMEKRWDSFEKMGFKNFQGTHPEIMKSHPLYGEKLY